MQGTTGLLQETGLSQDSSWLGKYRILRLLACGGMADVYLAVMTGPYGFEKTVALKLMHPQISGDPPFVNMFIDEAKICAGLVHPNIVQILDFGEINSTLYIAMEYVEGINLAEFVRALVNSNEQPRIDVSLYITAEILNALLYTASIKDSDGANAGIVHRDITPHNILLSPAGDVKLTDFGIAKARGSITTTVAGTLKGKLRYMSPEQARGERLDGRSDLYSLALILYELVTHRQAYAGDTDMTLLRQVQASHIDARPSQINAALPPELDAIVLRALSGMPGERFQTPASFRQALCALRPDFDRAKTHLAALVHDLPGQQPQQACTPGLPLCSQQTISPRENHAFSLKTAAYCAGGTLLLFCCIMLLPASQEPGTPYAAGTAFHAASSPAQDPLVHDDGFSPSARIYHENTATGEPPPGQRAAARGVLVINAIPWARVYIADAAPERFAGITPIQRYSVQPGSHTLVFKNKAYGTRRIGISIASGEKKIVVLHYDPSTGTFETAIRTATR